MGEFATWGAPVSPLDMFKTRTSARSLFDATKSGPVTLDVDSAFLGDMVDQVGEVRGVAHFRAGGVWYRSAGAVPVALCEALCQTEGLPDVVLMVAERVRSQAGREYLSLRVAD